MLKLNGSFGEGGGQIVRTALALSAITGKPFEVSGIRKGRCDSGLKAQHLYCVKALEELCNAKTEGAELASCHLKFHPGEIKSKTISVDVGTAGSISLLLQALLPPAMFANSSLRLKITGGTEGKFAMPYDYFAEVLVPHLRKYAGIEVSLLKRGYFPKGGGKVEIKIRPEFKLPGYDNFEKFHEAFKEKCRKINLMQQGRLIQIKGISHASKELEKAEVAERQARAAKLALSKFECPLNINSEYSETLSTGSGIALWAVFSSGEEIDFNNPVIIGADALGERGKRAEIVGKEAAENLIKEIESKAPVDHHLADQILPFMALAGKSSIKVSEVTNHCRTNIYVIEQFLGKVFEVDEENKIIRTVD